MKKNKNLFFLFVEKSEKNLEGSPNGYAFYGEVRTGEKSMA